MKILVKEDKVEVFKPITIEVTLESLGELEALWHRLNVSVDDVKKSSNDSFRNGIDMAYDNYIFWAELDKIAEDNGWK